MRPIVVRLRGRAEERSAGTEVPDQVFLCPETHSRLREGVRDLHHYMPGSFMLMFASLRSRLAPTGPHRLRHRGRVPVGGRRSASLLMPVEPYRRIAADCMIRLGTLS